MIRKYRLWDSQWVNVVNAPVVLNALYAEEAVAEAVKLVEKFMALNIAQNNWPPINRSGQDRDAAVQDVA